MEEIEFDSAGTTIHRGVSLATWKRVKPEHRCAARYGRNAGAVGNCDSSTCHQFGGPTILGRIGSVVGVGRPPVQIHQGMLRCGFLTKRKSTSPEDCEVRAARFSVLCPPCLGDTNTANATAARIEGADGRSFQSYEETGRHMFCGAKLASTLQPAESARCTPHNGFLRVRGLPQQCVQPARRNRDSQHVRRLTALPGR